MEVTPGQDSDTLIEMSAVKLQKQINARLDRWAMIFGVDPRDTVSQGEILERFSEEYPPSEAGHYYVIPDIVDSFCERICGLAAERSVRRFVSGQERNHSQGTHYMRSVSPKAMSRAKMTKPTRVVSIVVGAMVLLLIVLLAVWLSGPSAEDRRQMVLQQEREQIEMEEKRLKLAKEARAEEERLAALRQEAERQAEADRLADEQRRKDLQKKREDERSSIIVSWREAAFGSVPSDTFEALLNKLDGDGYTPDQKDLVFNREGKDKWFVVRGPVNDVGTFMGKKYVTVQVNSENLCDVYPREDFDIMSYRKGQGVCFVGQYTCRGTGIMTHHDVRNAKAVSE